VARWRRSTRGGSKSTSIESCCARASASVVIPPVNLRYSSMLNKTWDGLPRSVINTGPSKEAFLALAGGLVKFATGHVLTATSHLTSQL